MINPQPIQLSPLPYSYDALEPALSAEQIRVHYEDHHAAYVDAANSILQAVGGSAEGFGRAPSRQWERWLFAASGARLHELYWETFTPGGRNLPSFLADHIGSDLYSLRRDLVREALEVQGSGWACLSRRSDSGDMIVHSIQNHDYPWEELEPLIVIDVWEHAYLISHSGRGKRARYAEAILALVDWVTVEHRLLGRQGPVPR